jgi:hypothetical protein
MELSIFSNNINESRLFWLKRGLLQRNMLIDGFRHPYQVLIPFLTLRCLRLERLELAREAEGEMKENNTTVKYIVLDVLADTVNVLSVTGSMPRTPVARN